MDEPMAAVGNNISPTPAPSVDNVPAGAGLSGMVTSSMADSTPQVVQINLLHLDVALKPPGTNLHGGIKISVW